MHIYAAQRTFSEGAFHDAYLEMLLDIPSRCFTLAVIVLQLSADMFLRVFSVAGHSVHLTSRNILHGDVHSGLHGDLHVSQLIMCMTALGATLISYNLSQRHDFPASLTLPTSPHIRHFRTRPLPRSATQTTTSPCLRWVWVFRNGDAWLYIAKRREVIVQRHRHTS